MADYSFVTLWHLEAPIQEVWDVIFKIEDWPTWWKSVKSVTKVEPGDAHGMGSLWRYVYRSKLPYTLEFETRTTRIEPPYFLEGTAVGELVGTGLWTLSQQGSITTVQYDWNVKTTKAWMELLAPIARPLFSWNHNVSMEDAGESLARLLNTRLVKQLTAAA
jgi:polyketide cyclase/dehydrase/lipid transport protein